jgi:hypothetical protein
MLGSFEDILKRNEEKYHTIQQKITCNWFALSYYFINS